MKQTRASDPDRRTYRAFGRFFGTPVRAIISGALVVVIAVCAWLGVSLGMALTAPGTDSVAARVAEWGREHGLGWAVTSLEHVQYQLSKPKTGGTVAGGLPSVGTKEPSATPKPSATPTTLPSPAALTPIVTSPTLAGEGQWSTLYSVHGSPAARVAFLRPDTIHTSYYVQVIWMDPKLVSFQLYPGYQVPGPTAGGPNQIPADKLGSVLATFNSGFLMADANGGYWQNGRAIVPLRTGAASMVFTADGHVRIEPWPGGNPAPDVVAVRQNLDMLIQNGVVAPSANQANAVAWGKTVGNRAYVWRSAIGVRADGSIVSVVGPAMDIGSLANILKAAGAVNAMELDINPSWTNYITYTHPTPTSAVPSVLPPPNSYVNAKRYIQPSSRDFVAVYPR